MNLDIKQNSFTYLLIFSEIVIFILYGLFVDYGEESVGQKYGNSNTINNYYPFFQDVHVMIFIGFGFLMTFLKKFSFSSVGLNFIISAFAIQWSMIVNGVIHNIYEGHASQKISLGITNLITSD